MARSINSGVLILKFPGRRFKPWNLTRQCAKTLAAYAAATGQSVFSFEEVTAHTSSAVAWMTSLGVLDGGHVTESFITLKTVISDPQAVPACDSRISIRFFLRKAGWSAGTGRDAAIQSQRFNNDGSLEYFMLLKHYGGQIASYDERYGFRHSQAKAYYDSLLACFSSDAEFALDKQYVAPQQKLEFYKALQSFFAGLSLLFSH